MEKVYKSDLERVYEEYCAGASCRHQLWDLVGLCSEQKLNYWILKTGVKISTERLTHVWGGYSVLSPEVLDRNSLITDITCHVMRRLDKKELIGTRGGIRKSIEGLISTTASNFLRDRKEDFCHSIPFSRTAQGYDKLTNKHEQEKVYLCPFPGCMNTTREEGQYCQIHDTDFITPLILYTIAEAAKELALTTVHIGRLIKSGEIASIDSGTLDNEYIAAKQKMISRTSLLEYINSHHKKYMIRNILVKGYVTGDD